VNAGSASVSTHRSVTVGLVERTATGSTSETLVSGSVTGGYMLGYAGWTHAPEVTHSVLKMSGLEYSESGGDAGVDLSVHTDDTTALRAFAGLAASTDYEVLGGHLVPQLLAGWTQSFDTSGVKVSASYVSAPQASFALVGPQTEHSGFLGAAHFDFGNDFTTISLGYDGTVSGKTTMQAANLRITARF
jgi:hypothetical protein